MISRQIGGNSESYTPPEGVYWDLAKNVGYVPFTPMSESGKEYFPSLYVEFVNALDAKNYGSGGNIFTFGANFSGGRTNGTTAQLDSGSHFTLMYKYDKYGGWKELYGFSQWYAMNGAQSIYVLGGETQGKWYKNGTAQSNSVSKISYRDLDDGYIKFGCNANGFVPTSYPTNASLLADLANINGIEGGECKLRQFIYWSDGTSFTSLEELIANRNTAEVDIRFDAQGNPYNSGTSGELIFTNV